MRRRQIAISLKSMILMATLVAVTMAGLGAAAEGRLDWIEFHADDKPLFTKEISDSVSVGVAAEFSAQRSENLNLNFTDDENEDEIEIEVDLGLLYDNGKTVRSYLEFNLSSERLGGVETNARDLALDVNQAYVTFRSRDRNQALTIGRWPVSDEREWLFDEELDGVHIFRRGENFAFELMYAREQIFIKDLLDDHHDDEPDHFYARAFANLPGENVGSIYSLYQLGHDPADADLLWLGASFAGRAENNIDCWAEIAHVRGTEKGRSVHGYGFDVGITKTFRQFRLDPRLTIGFAFGSGDDRTRTDTGFRQTGFQGNSARFGSRSSLKYYGEVFDPELSNLAILTVGTGFDLFEKSSVDVMYHYSVQHKASSRIRDSALDQRPSGRHRQLGHEINFVVAYREFEKSDIDYYGGVFVPGSAFANSGDVAGVIGLEISVQF